ncbi:MAG: radical SAM protein [Chloroflexi bacterium AL-W]|nr:radical SAM protein [Chloroflexi bacterium AL-N1]NOK67674.1 radical SAM protein [Chloroflexi bacterium AL-N10]NOK75556.1 radical SAM protein [Chloroflexi bacterium AL-N5]NOK82344.1 radical SAM protein [Chloroflexi bacterium AL-W]NOK90189.1 radical SAM protein [Chloroflexi bacterium AL-N15]
MLRVLLMQLPVPNNPVTNTPLAAGYLKAYAHLQGLLERVAINMLPRSLADVAGDAMLVDYIVKDAPDVLGISLYTWNSERSLDIARRVKARLPHLIVVVGGPEVQHDNIWVLQHSGVDVAVIGEGEQTFAELLRVFAEKAQLNHAILADVAGIAFRDVSGKLIVTPGRVALDDLSDLPSPYLLGYIEPGPMVMVEVSRWCPYSCSFCLYGRNMGPRLGNRYFSLERILAEIRWAQARGVTQVHFIEANLNLVPLFRPLMQALADLNADGQLALYAELRGEHLTAPTVDALAQAGLRVAEVGLQSANPAALRASLRRTDLAKWAEGTRRLYAHGVEVLLDVIIGLPEDDVDGVGETLNFIERENLGMYDIFTLQMLPGTAVRQQAAQYHMVYQERPPYYVLSTDRLPYDTLQRMRAELKIGAGLDPHDIEGCPSPRTQALSKKHAVECHNVFVAQVQPVTRLSLLEADTVEWEQTEGYIQRLSSHVDIIVSWCDQQVLAAFLARAMVANPATLFDVYWMADEPPSVVALHNWRDALPYQPGYLDRLAVYCRAAPDLRHQRVSPRMWLVVPWVAQVEPHDYVGVAEIIWEYHMSPDWEAPMEAWKAAGGAGIWLRGASPQDIEQLQTSDVVSIWCDRG